MKIVFIQPVLPIYDIDFFNALQERFSSIELLVLADIKTKDELNQSKSSKIKFQIEHLRQVNFCGLIFRPGLFRLIQGRAYGFTVIYNSNPRDVTQFLAMILSWLMGRQFFSWGMFHRIGGPRIMSNFYYKVIGQISSKTLCYSRIGATNLISLGVPPSKIGIVGTAIDERVPMAIKSLKTQNELIQFRALEGLTGKHIVLQVVRLSRYKRPELFIAAAELVLEKRNDIVFVLVGGGEMFKELKELVKHKNLDQNIRFLGPIYDEKILSNWYLSASAFVVPTCIGLSAHHAMAYGVPVITDDSLNMQASEFEVVSNGLNGLVYKEGDILSLASKINTLISSEELRTRMSENAFSTIKNVYSMGNKVENFANLVMKEFVG
jgi:glycosyltransferase involved in cell wall biosynthesis